MFGEYGNGFNQYPPMQQQSQYPFIQQKPAQFTPQPQQPVVKPPSYAIHSFKQNRSRSVYGGM